MNRHPLFHPAYPLFALLGVFMLTGFARADAKESEKKDANKTAGVVGGLMTDFKDTYMLVQLDGEDEPTQFVYGPGVTQKSLANSHIFPVDRVNVKWKLDGDDKKVLAVEKVNGKQTGVAVGKVIKVYNNFWVSVKPSNGGMIEGFALNGPGKSSTAGFDLLKTLQPDDLVAIKYATDFERHRILQIEVKPAPAK